MSGTKKYEYNGLPGFDIDPTTGKYFPVFGDTKGNASVFGSSSKRAQPNWSSSKDSKSNDWQASQPNKFRKTETGVRKELFRATVQQNNSAADAKGPRYSSTFKNLWKPLPSTRNDASKGNSIKKSSKKHVTPLVTISEQPENRWSIQQELGYQFQPPGTPQLRFATTATTTPTGQESEMEEFIKLEGVYKTPKLAKDSPVTSVCNLFGSKMLLLAENEENSNIVKKPSNRKEVMAEIQKIAKCNRDLSDVISAKIKEVVDLRAEHQRNVEVMMGLVATLEESGEEPSCNKLVNGNKENSSIRRSLRLQHKSPNRSSPPSGSPGILKPDDLRKSTLTKSLVHKYQKYQIDSPRIQKALDMYNSARTTCNVLVTPKISRGRLVGAPASPSSRNDLSFKIQQQCLMLQDTPAHK